jgi:c(7)-type cytochrome triheme protein
VNGDRMHQKLCGACHDGKAAFGVEEGCDVCHQQ